MAGRKIRDEADARTCIARVEASGLAPRAWAHRYGIDGRSLRAWTLNLSRTGRPARAEIAPRAALVELVPTRGTTARTACVIRIGAASIDVAPGFDEATLQRVLRVLASC